MDRFDREVEALENDLDSGRITLKEFTREMRELRHFYQAAAQEAAEEAYRNEMGRW